MAYLAVHAGAPQPRGYVAGLFWPESTEAQARTNLRKELHQLRGALPDPEGCLRVDAQALCWLEDAPCAVDVIAFERAADEAEAAAEAGDEAAFLAAAERAVGAYGGNLLPGFYDDWVLAERERLRRRCVSLLDRLTALLAEQREIEGAVAHARRRVELEPLEEPGYRTLMTLQARAGDRAGALRTFHRCTSTLDHELGVEPAPETMAVYENLVARTAKPATDVSTLRQAVPLIGRAAEVAALERAWEQAGGGSRIALVAGEAGVGKTRLATELAARVARGGEAVVAHARCFASRGRLALAPVAEWLRSPAIRRGVEHLEPVWRAEVGRLVPELAAGDEPTRQAPLADAWQRRQFFEGLARAVLAAGRPTLFVLDDLQWCDAETLAWLELLVHLDPAAPLLVVATLRREELEDNPELVGCCRRLRAAGLLDEVELAPLRAEEAAELAAGLSGRPLDGAAARRLLAGTGGFPLFVVEAVREGSPRSARVDAVLAGRLAQLDEPARNLAGLAAAVGRDFSLELLVAAGDLDDDALVEAVDELWRRRLLREHSATTYDFSHDLLRDAAYAQLSPPHRRLAHQRIAAALEALHADDLEVVAAQIADQHERGGQPDRAIDYHAQAAEAATVVFAHDDAVAHYERALDLLTDLPAGTARDRRELALRQGMVPPLLALRGYAAPSLGASLERMTELGEQLGEEAVAVRSEAARWAHLFVLGRTHEAAVLTDRLMTRAAQHPEHIGQLCVANAGALTSLGRLRDALARFALLEEQTDVAEVSPLGFPVRVMGLGWQAHALWLAGRSDDAAASAAAALDLAEELDHPFSRAIAQGYGAITQHLLSHVERTAELAASVRRLCDRHDFAYYGDWGRILEGWATGGAAGEARIREGLERLQRAHAGARRPFWLALLADVLAGAGRAREASRVLAEARAWAEEQGDRWWLAEACRLGAALGPEDEAERLLGNALAVAREQGAVALELRAATDLARRLLDTGDGDQAAGLLEPVRARAGGCNPADVAAADALLAAA